MSNNLDDALTTIRTRLGLLTPCPYCVDPYAIRYCSTCIQVLADLLGVSVGYARRRYGRKPSVRH